MDGWAQGKENERQSEAEKEDNAGRMDGRKRKEKCEEENNNKG